MTDIAAKKPTIKLGLMPPLSGLVELYGPEISNAGRIAVDEINERGGVLGHQIELVIRDDGSLPETAIPAAEHLVDELGCVAIIGNLLSNSRIAVANRVAETRKVPYLNFSFYEGSIWSRYFFNFAALPNQQIEKMIPFMAKRFGPKMYFSGSNYEWPRGSIDAGKRALIGEGGEIVGERYLPIGSNDIEGLLDDVARSGADVFVPYFAGTDQINLLNRFTEKGLKDRMAVVMGHYDEAMVGQMSPAVRTGLYSSNTYFMSVDTPENHAYLNRLAQLPEVDGIWPNGNGVLTNFGEGTYVCVHAFAKAAEKAGTFESEALVEALKHISVKGPQGRVDMDPLTHHAKVNSYLTRCEYDGTFTMIENFGRTDPVIPARYRSAIPGMEKAPMTKLSGIPRGFIPKVIGSAPKPAPSADVSESERILNSADSAILSTDENGTIIQANERSAMMFGYPLQELIGLNVSLLMPPHLRKGHGDHMYSFVHSNKTNISMGRRGEVLGYRKDGSEFPAEAAIAKFKSDDGWVLVATMRDISNRKQREEDLMWRATHDALTNLPNRSLIRDRLATALERSKRTDDAVALMFIDMDGFKLINDSYGHDMGDKLLVAMGERLGDVVRPGDTVARFGGDEFIILCDQIQDESAVASLADRILRALREPFDLEGNFLYATISLGLAIGQGTTHLPDELMRNADSAMYRAKDQGRDGWQIFNDEIHRHAKEQLVLANGLRTAIDNDEMFIVLQPIVDPVGNTIIGAETLLRWKPNNTFIGPDLFIPIAEKTGSILPIGAWVFEQTCKAQCELDKLPESIRPKYLSVNVSARQFTDRNLVKTFASILEKTGADASLILLEITETSLMEDIEVNIDTLHQLGELGHTIAVDDFGTGYSSLAQLIRLPVNALKVDRAFVDGLENSESNRAIVSAVISMAHALNHKVIAEGVETEAQLKVLNSLSCDCVQGYYFHKPMLLEDFVAVLTGESNAAVSA